MLLDKTPAAFDHPYNQELEKLKKKSSFLKRSNFKTRLRPSMIKKWRLIVELNLYKNVKTF